MGTIELPYTRVAVETDTDDASFRMAHLGQSTTRPWVEIVTDDGVEPSIAVEFRLNSASEPAFFNALRCMVDSYYAYSRGEV